MSKVSYSTRLFGIHKGKPSISMKKLAQNIKDTFNVNNSLAIELVDNAYAGNIDKAINLLIKFFKKVHYLNNSQILALAGILKIRNNI